jgi:hypothetical protein
MASKKNLATIIIGVVSSVLPSSTLAPSISSLVVRITKSDKCLLDNLMSDYSETMGNIFEKSLMLYRSIVEAGEQGGKFLMLTGHLRAGIRPDLVDIKSKTSNHNRKYNDLYAYKEHEPVGTINRLGDSENTKDNNKFYNIDHETILAVRDQFAEKGITPISLNRIYIKAAKGLKSERIAIRASSAFIERLKDIEKRTGSNKSDLLRDSLHLYNFVKREFDKGDATFYIGEIRVEGI